ncbi:DUF6671 family protein [Flavobacterium sp.]|uniref:DUF6671 family protein n=1 Tax=Flavobacterium sp. TaxID=239 RepID=UPI002FDAB6FC
MLFKNRKLLIATQHEKERVLAPLLEQELGVVSWVPSDYNTDKWGTFSGEIPRLDSMKETVKQKCLEGMKHYGFDLGVASEGSFGPHPELFFGSCDFEMLVFIDLKNELEIYESHMSWETNFSVEEIKDWESMTRFSERIQFPTHGLILKSPQSEIMYKEALNWDDLSYQFQMIQKEFGSVVVETDMRAHRNPTRMQVIAQAGTKLAQAIQSQCPSCGLPGFQITYVEPGLPCEWCLAPTRSPLAFHYSCVRCSHTLVKKFPLGQEKQSPEFCMNCNP